MRQLQNSSNRNPGTRQQLVISCPRDCVFGICRGRETSQSPLPAPPAVPPAGLSGFFFFFLQRSPPSFFRGTGPPRRDKGRLISSHTRIGGRIPPLRRRLFHYHNNRVSRKMIKGPRDRVPLFFFSRSLEQNVFPLYRDGKINKTSSPSHCPTPRRRQKKLHTTRAACTWPEYNVTRTRNESQRYYIKGTPRKCAQSTSIIHLSREIIKKNTRFIIVGRYNAHYTILA